MTTANKIIIKRKPTVVKKKPIKKSVAIRKKRQTKKQKVISRQPLAISEGQLIKRKSDCYWKEMGWKMSYLRSIFYRSKVYTGKYRTKHASFRGEIIGGKFYILSPSPEILRGPHGPCFTPVKSFLDSQKYIIHFSPDSPDINSKIKSVEETIVESLTT